MTKKQTTCLFLLMILIFLFSGTSMSGESKVDQKPVSDKPQTEKMIKHHPLQVFPWTDKKYSMRIIRPNPNLDPEIVKNTFDPNVDYKLRIIDPYTRKEITGYKGPCFGLLHKKFKYKGKKYETPINSSAE